MHFDGVEAKLSQRAFQANLVLGQSEPSTFECVNDFVRSDTAVQVTFVVRVGLDRDRLFRQFIREIAIAL